MTKVKNLVYLVLCILLLSGCSEINSSQTKDNVNDLNSIITSYIAKYNTNLKIDNLKIKSNVDTSEGNLVQVLFQNKDEEYIGLFQISKQDKKVIFSSINPGDSSVPFDVHVMTSYIKKGNEDSPYIFLGGFINEKNIKGIDIKFDDNSIAELVFNENQESYSYSRIGSTDGIKEIIAKDGEGKKLYIYPPYPPTKL